MTVPKKPTLRLNKTRDLSQSVQTTIERQPINAPQIGITPRARNARSARHGQSGEQVAPASFAASNRNNDH